jgi:histidinol-phosphate aminotransferase
MSSQSNPLLKLAAEGISGLAPYQPGKPAEELQREYGLTDVIKLASNENPFGPSPSVAPALAAAANEIARYPDGAGFVLRERLARHLNVRPAQLTLGNGSNDVLVLLAEAFLTPDVSAVYDQYSFVVYRLAVQACGAHAKVAPANPRDHRQPLGHDLAAMHERVDESTRLVFIANPNNPTGSWLEQGDIRAFLNDMPEHVITVLDEAYLEYSQQSGDQDAIDWLSEFPRLVVVRTFSKAYGLAGLRVGYSVSSEAIAELLNRVRQPFNVNSMAQAGAIAALGDQQWLQQGVAASAAGMEQLERGLQTLGLSWIPSRGNFLLVDLETEGNATAMNDYLLRAGVIVRPVANYGLPAWLRITVGSEAENERLLGAMNGFLNQS